MSSGTEGKILRTAHSLFESQGFSATSLRHNAEEAGVGKATIYHHFKDKNSFFMALLDQASSNLMISPAELTAETDPRKRIRKATFLRIEFLAGMMDLMNIARREVPQARAKWQSENGRAFRALSAMLADSIRQGIAQHIFRSVNPTQTASIVCDDSRHIRDVPPFRLPYPFAPKNNRCNA